MFQNTLTAKQMIEQAEMGAYVEIRDGVYLASAETLEEEQVKWDDADQAKEFDFSGAPYWITDDAGTRPVAIYGADDPDLIKALEEVEPGDTHAEGY